MRIKLLATHQQPFLVFAHSHALLRICPCSAQVQKSGPDPLPRYHSQASPEPRIQSLEQCFGVSQLELVHPSHSCVLFPDLILQFPDVRDLLPVSLEKQLPFYEGQDLLQCAFCRSLALAEDPQVIRITHKAMPAPF